MKIILLPFLVIFIIIADGVAKYYAKPLEITTFILIGCVVTATLYFLSGKQKALQSIVLFGLLAFVIY